ncbi:MAG TPA: GNAT family N-acetyltransferase [Bacteroidia bacterium]|nr:GNAT family N-acetyltransferase [Bacteroidia bacterium]
MNEKTAPEILNSTEQDTGTIFELYRSATEYQLANGYNLWKEFDPELIATEIREKRHWKIIIDGSVACIFSIFYSDPLLWGELDNNHSIYIHRIATNPVFKGKGMTNLIIDWVKSHAKETGRKFIRIDTWADNKNLSAYYIKCGFHVVGHRQLDKEAKGLPKHYSTLSLVLLEISI